MSTRRLLGHPKMLSDLAKIRTSSNQEQKDGDSSFIRQGTIEKNDILKLRMCVSHGNEKNGSVPSSFQSIAKNVLSVNTVMVQPFY